MDEYAAWKKFTETGSVSDYLDYCRIKLGYKGQAASKQSEEDHETKHGRFDPD